MGKTVRGTIVKREHTAGLNARGNKRMRKYSGERVHSRTRYVLSAGKEAKHYSICHLYRVIVDFRSMRSRAYRCYPLFPCSPKSHPHLGSAGVRPNKAAGRTVRPRQENDTLKETFQIFQVKQCANGSSFRFVGLHTGGHQLQRYSRPHAEVGIRQDLMGVSMLFPLTVNVSVSLLNQLVRQLWPHFVVHA